ncbi:MAG TPA: TonB-dependent receptor [Gammaproteobacteria bacterium]|nr:TonB-dependent receptor [Gammaproteobacteria bacterium]
MSVTITKSVSACCILVPAIACSLAAWSAEEATRLGTVTVTGAAIEEDNTYQLDTEEVAGIAPDAASLLHKVPGANVNRNGALTGIAQYRGLFGDRINVKVNGISVQEGCPNSMDPPLSFIPGTQLDNIEVIRGIAPVSSGLETLGGTLRATSIRPAFGSGDDMEAHGSLRLSGATVNDSGAAGVLTGVANRTHRLHLAGSREAGDDIEFNGGTIRPSGHERDSYALGYGFRQAGHEVGLDVAHIDTGPTGTPSLPMDIEMADTDMVSGEYAGYLGAHAVHGQLFHTDVHHKMTNFLLRPLMMNMMPMRSTSDGTGTGFRLDVGRALVGGDLLVGIDGQLATHDALITNPDNPMFQVVNFNDVERNLAGVFGEWEGALGAGWHSEFGLRVNQVRMDAGVVSHSMAAAAALQDRFNNADRSQTDTNVDWVARFMRPLSASTDFEIGFARKIRSPSYQERYLWVPLEATGGLADGMTYIGDINLDPEVSHQVELALNMETTNAYFEPRIFYRDISDYIQGIPTTDMAAIMFIDMMNMMNGTNMPYPLQYANVDATLYGADAAWGYRLKDHWSLGGIVSYVRGKRDDVSDNLYRIAPLNGTLGLTYATAAWDVTAEGVFYDRQDKVSATNGETETGGYALMNLYGKYQVTKDLKLSGGIGNVFDRRYAAHLSGVNRADGSDVAVGERVPGEGRNVYLAVQLDW